MCNPAKIDPVVQTPVAGDNSSLEAKSLQDSIETITNINVSSSIVFTIVLFLTLLAGFLIYRTTKNNHSDLHRRIHNLASLTGFGQSDLLTPPRTDIELRPV